MLIRSITLENVKSYRKATINFSEGINFIHGINGAGKTTIIESIGFVLFDSRELKYGELVRYGERQARISLEFEADDGRVYKIERRFTESKQISWSIYDVETDSELIELHGSDDITYWLRKIMHLDEEVSLADVFRDVIGVPQGTFTAPFLETPAKRRSTFDGILKVEGYRLASDRLRSSEKQLDEDIHVLDKDLAVRRQRVENYEEIKEKYIEANSKLGILEKSRLELNQEMGIKREELKDLESIKLQLDKANQEEKVSQNRIETFEERLGELKEEVKSAESAVIEMKEYAPGYEEYLKVEQEIEELEKEQGEWQKQRDIYAELRQNIEKVKATIESKEENKERLEEDKLEEFVKESEKQLKDEYLILDKEKRQLDSWDSEIDLYNRLAENRMEESRGLIRGIDEYLNGIRLLTEHMIPGIKEKEAQLENLSELEQEVNQLDQKEELLNDLLAKKYRLAERIETFRFSQSKAEGGNCPFLEEPCQNIEGDNLTEHFEEALIEMKRELDSLDQEITRNQIVSGNAREKLAGLRLLANQLKEKQEKRNDHERYLSEKREQLAGHYLFTDDFLARGIQGTLTQGEIEEGILVIRQSQDMIARLGNRLLNKEVNEVQGWSSLGQYVDKLQEDIKQLGKSMERAYGIEERQFASREAGLNQKKITVEADKKRLLEQHEMMDKLVNELSNLRIDLNNYMEQVRVYEEEIEKGKHIVEDVKKRKVRKQELYPVYLRCLEKKPLAESFTEVVSRRDKQLDLIDKERKTLEETKELIIVLMDKYQEEKHESLKSEIEELVGRVGALNREIEERLEDIKGLSKDIDLMEVVIKEIQAEELKLKRKRKARALVSLSRKLLKEAAEPVADILRQYISVDANRYYQQISKENVQLIWDKDYEVVLLEVNGTEYKRRSFKQLSGGEQMSAALAVRLALLKNLSSVGLGFFDEPTTNLDGRRRFNLAEILQGVNTEFNQLFLISHDDTFDSITEHVIHLEKEKETLLR